MSQAFDISDRASRRATLSDGAEIRLHALSPQDAPGLQAGLQRLSPQSRYRRFGRPVERFSSAELHYLTAVDQRRHVAWAACDPSFPGGLGIGVARFVCLEERPGTAEVALAVVDSHQRRGLGTLFLALLWVEARALGIERFCGQVLADNRPMLSILEQLGAEVEGGAADCINLSARLPDSLEAFPRGALGQRAQAAARQIQRSAALN